MGQMQPLLLLEAFTREQDVFPYTVCAPRLCTHNNSYYIYTKDLENVLSRLCVLIGITFHLRPRGFGKLYSSGCCVPLSVGTHFLFEIDRKRDIIIPFCRATWLTKNPVKRRRVYLYFYKIKVEAIKGNGGKRGKENGGLRELP